MLSLKSPSTLHQASERRLSIYDLPAELFDAIVEQVKKYSF
jgi:hypothetical protein